MRFQMLTIALPLTLLSSCGSPTPSPESTVLNASRNSYVQFINKTPAVKNSIQRTKSGASCQVIVPATALTGALVAKGFSSTCATAGLVLIPVTGGAAGTATIICGGANASQIDAATGAAIGAAAGLAMCTAQGLSERITTAIRNNSNTLNVRNVFHMEDSVPGAFDPAARAWNTTNRCEEPDPHNFWPGKDCDPAKNRNRQNTAMSKCVAKTPECDGFHVLTCDTRTKKWTSFGHCINSTRILREIPPMYRH